MIWVTFILHIKLLCNIIYVNDKTHIMNKADNDFFFFFEVYSKLSSYMHNRFHVAQISSRQEGETAAKIKMCCCFFFFPSGLGKSNSSFCSISQIFSVACHISISAALHVCFKL